jgi:hypothetical protein
MYFIGDISSIFEGIKSFTNIFVFKDRQIALSMSETK